MAAGNYRATGADRDARSIDGLRLAANEVSAAESRDDARASSRLNRRRAAEWIDTLGDERHAGRGILKGLSMASPESDLPRGFADAIAHKRDAVRDRERIRLAVHSALRHAAPADVDEPFDAWRKPGGLQLIHDYLDTLIDVVRADPDGGVDAWRAAAKDRLCPGCKESIGGHYCPLPAANACLFERHLDLVTETIRRSIAAPDEHA
jgi:hypothetical protein